MPRPVVVVHPHPVKVVVAPTAAEVLAIGGPAPRIAGRGAVVIAVEPGAQNPEQAAEQQVQAAQAQMQAAQNSCAQADAYQGYVNNVIQSQNNTSDNINQVLQTLADNSSDPNLQQALESSIGQPDPINDALQQQLQNQASAFENICQAKMAAAQNSEANAEAQLAAVQPGGASGAGYQAGYQAGLAAAQGQTSGGAGDGSPAGAAAGSQAVPPAAPAQGQPGGACAPTAPSGVPAPQGQWGAWAALGDTGLVFDVTRVNDKTVTWRFLNAGANTIASMQFTYSYVDADSGQPASQQDVLPYALKPGASVGGWAAYTANTRGAVQISINQIACQ